MAFINDVSVEEGEYVDEDVGVDALVSADVKTKTEAAMTQIISKVA